MPTYDYECRDCGGFDAIRALRDRNEPAPCPHCAAASPRVFASAPRLGLLEESTRRAMDVNERASHEPKTSRDYQRFKHPAGCGCCSNSSRTRKATVTAPNGAKAFPSKRPWMISH
ncbi:zinc ribbon domain-containing protein [Variovorax dokdonensis]|uniref:Zinc ribbon domain-containing protein n=1 Tax=Variovorax dokdonensis TaxID=344883 RepID=A0ABT7ND42_9BURK|nr:zinc ribbon domain-containing protein [Variovorax dokdonensis]MDM0045881.1 zinc ribbon domain-containing protein [Variovorax dokdonensis]